MQVQIRQLHADKEVQRQENCQAVKYWEEKMAAKDALLVEMTATRDGLQLTANGEIEKAQADAAKSVKELQQELGVSKIRLESQVEDLSDKLGKVVTFRANMEKREAEVAAMKKKLQELELDQKAEQDNTEREMYEEGVRCKKIVSTAKGEGMNMEELEHALRQRVQKMDKEGNRIGLSQLEAMVTLVAKLIRNGSGRRRVQVDEDQNEEAPATPGSRLPQVPSLPNIGSGRSRKKFIRVKEDRAVEFPLVPMPSSARTSKESYARWRWQFEGQYGGPGRVRA